MNENWLFALSMVCVAAIIGIIALVVYLMHMRDLETCAASCPGGYYLTNENIGCICLGSATETHP